MNLGAEKNKVRLLAVLIAVAIGGWYYNSVSDSSPAPAAPRRAASPPAVVQAPRRAAARNNNATEFKPRLSAADPSTIDPELRLDLLAKVQNVPPMNAGRNLFQFGSAPAPLAPLPKVAGIPINGPGSPQFVQPPPPLPPVPSGPPPPAPINVKYYGYVISRSTGRKVAYLLDGDDVLLKSETDTVKGHYRIVQIGLNSIVVEETESKTRQTLPIQDQPG